MSDPVYWILLACICVLQIGFWGVCGLLKVSQRTNRQLVQKLIDRDSIAGRRVGGGS